ncbi:retrovirus-related pol polyprotein from transposon TNT 1-94 [Tanacetum coccineum]
MIESPLVDSGFVVPVFSSRDDLIACLNKAMAFLIAVASSRFLTTNNQLRTSSNPRNQATIQDGRVTVQQVQGRQGQNYSGTTYKSNATSSRGNTTSGQARVVKCYNCQGEGHMARQILDEDQLTEDLDTYDSDCDDLSTAQAVLMANISNYGSDIISEGKEIVENVVHAPSATTIALGMFKFDLEPLPPRLLQNREVHIDYLRNNKTANILREIVKQAKAKQPLDSELDFACKYAIRIQELLVYVQDTCPNAIKPSAKKVTVKPMNNVKKLRLSRLYSDSRTTRLQGLWGMMTIIWEMLLSQGYTTLKGLDIICVDLLLGSRDTNVYTISLDDMLKSSPICLLSKASKTKSWLWHRQLSHLKFDTLNKLAKDGLAQGISRLKFQKNHLCSACALGKSRKSSHQPKAEDTNQEKLYLLHMDLCGPMRVASINRKSSVDNFVRDPNPNSYPSYSPLQPQTSSFNQRRCFHCEDTLEEDEYCKRCTCKKCGSGLSKGFCFICASSNENSSIDDSNPNSFIDSPKVFNPPPQPLTHSIESMNDNPNFDDTPQEQSVHYQDPLLEQITSVCDMVGQYIQEKEEEKRIEEEQADNARYWKIPVCYDDDDDEENSILLKDIIISGLPTCVAITPDSPKTDSLIMEDEHLHTIPETESDKLIKSSVEDLVQSQVIRRSPKIDSLLDEFAGELTLLHSIPPGIDDVNLDPEVEDSDSLMEEIDIFLDGDGSIPPGIESDDYDSEDDDNSTSRPEFESFHVDYPDSGDSTIDVVEDIPVDIYDPGICIEVESTRFLSTLSPVIDTLLPFSSENEDKVFNHGVLAYKEKSPPYSSYQGLQLFSFSPEARCRIHGNNTH